VRADLENHLLGLLRADGADGVRAFLESLPGLDFAAVAGNQDHETRFESAVDDGLTLVVTLFCGPHILSANVTVEGGADTRATRDPDPRHQAFYTVWESLLGLSDSEVASLAPSRRAVYLVGSLEADVMNGGLGQYLSNTEGAHLAPTLECLALAGAPRTAAILRKAAALGTPGEFGAAWESMADRFEQLDEEFMETGEDLAGLTADAFLE
jgi:hypothetical protein